MQFEGVIAYHDYVTGVVSALIACDHIGLRGQDIGDLSLTFITPLGTN